jgi:error-prone DNA polymerase
MGLSRRDAFWQVLSIGKELPLFAGIGLDEQPMESRTGSPLPEMPLGEQIVADYDSTGLSLKAHPLSLVRDELRKRGVSTAAEIAEKPHRTSAQVAGMVLVRQRPGTAKGTVFITLEDESGVTNLVVWPRVWQRFRQVAHGAVALLAQGQVERTAGVLHVIVNKLEDLSDFLAGIASRSRDFR